MKIDTSVIVLLVVLVPLAYAMYSSNIKSLAFGLLALLVILVAMKVIYFETDVVLAMVALLIMGMYSEDFEKLINSFTGNDSGKTTNKSDNNSDNNENKDDSQGHRKITTTSDVLNATIKEFNLDITVDDFLKTIAQRYVEFYGVGKNESRTTSLSYAKNLLSHYELAKKDIVEDWWFDNDALIIIGGPNEFLTDEYPVFIPKLQGDELLYQTIYNGGVQIRNLIDGYLYVRVPRVIIKRKDGSAESFDVWVPVRATYFIIDNTVDTSRHCISNAILDKSIADITAKASIGATVTAGKLPTYIEIAWGITGIIAEKFTDCRIYKESKTIATKKRSGNDIEWEYFIAPIPSYTISDEWGPGVMPDWGPGMMPGQEKPAYAQ